MPKPKETQEDLGMSGPGVEAVRIKAIDKAIAEYVPIRDERIALSVLEKQAKKKLIDLVHANADVIGRSEDGAISYRTNEDILLTLTPTEEKLKVKTPKGEEDDGGEE